MALVAAAASTNTSVSVVELNPAANQTTPVQTLAIPSTGSSAIEFSATSTSNGYVANTNDDKYVEFTGANSTSAGNVNTLNPRAVVTVDVNGSVNIATTYTGSSGNQTRGATSLDDSTWYISDQGGFYSNNSTSSSPSGNPRAPKAFGGTVYVGANSTTAIQVNTLSAPTGGTLTPLPGLTANSNFQDFYLVSSGSNGSAFDELYVLNENSATVGSIAKYSLVGGSWTSNGTYATTFGGFGLAAARDLTAGTDLYATTGTGATAANSVIKLVDTAGFNSPITIATANNITLYTTPAGSLIKGVAFAPIALAPVISNLSPTTGPIAGGTTVHVNGTNFTAGSTISFNGSNIASSFVSGSQLSFTTPSVPSTGTVPVTVTTGSNTSNAVSFNYVASQSTLGGFSLSPSTDGIGQPATFTATGVTAPPGDSISYVNYYAEVVSGTENPTGDTLLGTSTTGSPTTYSISYTPNAPPPGGSALAAGTYQVYAQANSSAGAASNPSVAQSFTVTVPVIAFSASTFTFNGSSGTQVIPVSRSGDLADAVTVAYTFNNGTAVNGSNFTAPASGTLTFNSGSATPVTPLSVTINSSASQIGNLLFTISLNSASPANLSSSLGSPTTAIIQQTARPFTAGDLAVYQVGDGVSLLVSSGNQTYIAEYNSSGSLIQDFPLPTYASGTSTSEGFLSLSSNNQNLIVPGYTGLAPAGGNIYSNANGIADVINSAASVIGSAQIPVAQLANGNLRSATSDNGTNIWVGTNNAGVLYTANGSAGTAVQVSTTVTNVRAVEVIGGQLYVSTGSGSAVRVGTVGTGLPTSSGNTITNLPGYPASTGSPYQYALLHLNGAGTAPDTLYVADDSTAGGGILKYALISGVWTSEGVIGSGTNAVRGLTASVTSGTVTLFATTGGSSNIGGGTLYTAIDSAGSAAPPSTSTLTNLATAGVDTAFRGVALVPAAATPLPAWLAPGSVATFDGTTLTVSGAATIIADPNAYGNDPVVVESGAAAQLAIAPTNTNAVHIASLSLSSGAGATLPAAATTPVILLIGSTNALSIDSASKLDLGNGYLDVAAGNLGGITSQIATGFHGGSWSGNGIISTAAANDTTHSTALGAIVNGTLFTTLGGAAVDGTDVLVKYTYYGDADLNGKVDGGDYTRIDNGYLTGQTGWYNGDFNYDSYIDGSDYTLIDNNFNTQGTAFSPATEIAPPIQTATSPASSGPNTGTAASSFFSDKKVKSLLIEGLELLINGD